MGVPHVTHGAQLRSTQQTKRCRQFAERLADEAGPAGVRVWWSDENDSSAEAARALTASGAGAARRDALLDAVAAAVILARAFTEGAAVPHHVTPALYLASAPQKADRPPKDLVRYRELKLDALPRPQPAASAVPVRGMSVELLRRARGGATARLQSWGDLLIDDDDETDSASAAAVVEQLG